MDRRPLLSSRRHTRLDPNFSFRFSGHARRYGSIVPPGGNDELREDGGLELREDGGLELRE
jgi:hypothetical protein